jgi:hypothetical protein
VRLRATLRRLIRLGIAISVAAVFLHPIFAALAATNTPGPALFADAVLAWQAGRAAFDHAEFATNDARRSAIAAEGITACRLSLARSNSAPAHYYLALNLSHLARTRLLGALRLVGEMERELLRARAADVRFDHGGADRALAQLYRDAPGWPASVGSRSKARRHLRQLMEIAPDYPENGLVALACHLDWKDRKSARAAAEALEKRLPEARRTLTGETWEDEWAAWDTEWARLKARLAR